jgi:hypothetical protein
MMRNEKSPRARKESIVIQPLEDETLIYDLKSHKAHCLNLAAAMVWRRCDGRTSVEEIRSSIADELGTPVDKDVVWLALDQLSKAGLLAEPVAGLRLSRRELARRVGVAVSLPLVSSIIAPKASAAASCTPNTVGCIPPGMSCTSNLQCCSCNCIGGTCQ